MRNRFLIILLIPFLWGCSEINKIVKKDSPHQQYQNMLFESGLHDSELGRAWIDASNEALNSPVVIQLPYSEQAYFFSDKPAAFSYRFKAKRGEIIEVHLEQDTTNYKIFLDLYTLGGSPELKTFADPDENDVDYEVEEDSDLLVRIQPELLKGGSFSLTIDKNASLAFPVFNKDSRAVKSIWGDTRDGGKRSHEGIDIFAPKRTPVIAAGDGVITKTGTNNLGGKVVWLLSGGKSLYYAHLDTQMVTPGSYVKVGDTLGLVGNTGNARTTPPHLHFGIYVPGEGAVDPYPFVRNVFPEPEKLNVNKNIIGKWGRVKTTNAVLRLSPSLKDKSIAKIKKNTPFIVYGGTGSWFKVKLPDGITGYIASASAEPADAPVNILAVDAGDSLEINPGNNPFYILSAGRQNISVLGQYKDVSLVNYNNSKVLLRKS